MASKSPIFIVGCPRSGTTLLGLMLDSHPDISIAHEAGIFHFLYAASGRQKWRLSSIGGRRRLFEKMRYNPNLRGAFGENVVCSTIAKLQKEEKLTTKLIVDSLFTAFLKGTGKCICGEKTPTYYYHIGDIFSLYPQAAIICLIRDPRAVFASTKRYAKHRKASSHWWMKETSEGMSMRWLDSIESVMKWKHKIAFVKYEELIQSPDAVLTDLTQRYLNVPYDAAMLKYYERAEDKIADIPEWHKATTDKLSPANINRWRSELTFNEISRIEGILHKQMKQFGYELQTISLENTSAVKANIKRNIYILKRKADQSLRFTAWRILNTLR